MAAVAALLAALDLRDARPALLAFAAALAAGGSDTVASEIGKAWGTAHVVLITSLRACRPGTSGRDVARRHGRRARRRALALAALRRRARPRARSALSCRSSPAPPPARSLESVLGATLEAPGILNNDVLNFINTAIAACVAVVARGLLS